MFDSLWRDVEKEYRNDVERILVKNAEYIQKHALVASAPLLNFDARYRKVVIPHIMPIPHYKFYMHTDSVMATQDDTVLRYVPLIHNNAEYEDLQNFESTELAEKPLDRAVEVEERVMKRVFGAYDDLGLFNLKKTLENTSYDWAESKFLALNCLAQNIETPIEKLLRKWEAMFDKRRRMLYFDRHALDFYFCSVCYIFNCEIHEPMHSKHRVWKLAPSEQLNDTDREKIHRRCIGTMCPDSECNVSGNSGEVIAFIQEHYDIDPYVTALFFYFCTQSKISFSDFTRSSKDLVHKTKKRPSLLKNVSLDTFYTPCSHAGACTRNKECACWTKKLYCEDACFCEHCNNYFSGCRCDFCDPDCKCRAVSRECDGNCACMTCKNQSLARGNTKKTYIGRSTTDGFGLFAGEKIAAQDLVLEYCGEIVTDAEAERRGYFYDKRRVSYLFDVSMSEGDVHHAIDAMKMGNNSRFINHSRRPNIKASTLHVNGIKKIGFYALKNIREHTELFFDYRYEEEHKKIYNIRE